MIISCTPKAGKEAWCSCYYYLMPMREMRVVGNYIVDVGAAEWSDGVERTEKASGGGMIKTMTE